VATTGPLRGLGARLVWCALWGGFAIESVQAANRTPSALHDLVAGMQDGEPAWLRAIDRNAAHALAGHGTGVSIVLAVVCAGIALSVFAGSRVTRVGLVVSVVLAAVIWVVAENLGEIATGQATDPNSGPLLMLLAATYWPVRQRRVAGTATVDLPQREPATAGAA
jgi:hypothetical protein